MKLFAKVILPVLALMLASAAVADARPNPGKWKGYETSWLGDDGRWNKYSSEDSQQLPLSFRIRRRTRLRSFRATGYDHQCVDTTTGALTKLRVTPRIGKLKRHRRGRFSGKRVSSVAGRTLVVTVKGRFISPRRARGRLKVKMLGCKGNATLVSKWKAKGPKRRRPRSPSGGGGGQTGGVYCPPSTRQDADGNYVTVGGYYSTSGYCVY